MLLVSKGVVEAFAPPGEIEEVTDSETVFEGHKSSDCDAVGEAWGENEGDRVAADATAEEFDEAEAAAEMPEELAALLEPVAEPAAEAFVAVGDAVVAALTVDTAAEAVALVIEAVEEGVLIEDGDADVFADEVAAATEPEASGEPQGLSLVVADEELMLGVEEAVTVNVALADTVALLTPGDAVVALLEVVALTAEIVGDKLGDTPNDGELVLLGRAEDVDELEIVSNGDTDAELELLTLGVALCETDGVMEEELLTLGVSEGTAPVDSDAVGDGVGGGDIEGVVLTLDVALTD